MSQSLRTVAPAARLACEALEDRATPAAAYALSAAGLVSFDTAHPEDATTTAVTGVGATETLVGMDFRPADGQLYALGVDATADKATLYTVSLETGAATAVGTPGAVAFTDAAAKPADLPAASGGYSVAFDPATGQLRVVTGTGLNFRVDPAAGTPLDGNAGKVAVTPGTNPDAAVNGLPAGSTGVAAVAFAPTAAGTAGAQYALDTASDSLFLLAGSSGTLSNKLAVTLNGAPLDFTAVRGFDIPAGVEVAAPVAGDGATAGTTAGSPAARTTAVAALAVGGTTKIYEIDLTTGAATEIGAAPADVRSLILGDAPAATVEFTAATFTATEAGKKAEITLTRTGDLSAAATASVMVSGGTATPGTDFTGTSFVVTFAAGESTATLTIPVADDGTSEPDETVILTLSAPSSGVVGQQATATLTITDDGTPTPMPQPADPGVVIGSGLGAGIVEVLNADGTPRSGFMPYGPTMLMGVKVATADVNGDGVRDIITAPGMFSSHVKVFDGATGAELQSFFAFDPVFLFGLNIAAGDVSGDGKADVIVGTAFGSSHVKVFDGDTGKELLSFYALPSLGGVTLAAGDLNGDGKADLVVGAATGVAEVRAIDLNAGVVLRDFIAFPFTLGSGADVAVGDVTGDGRLDIVVGSGQTGGTVTAFDGRTGAAVRTLFAFAPSFAGGLSVGSADVNGDGIADVLVTANKGTDLTRFYDGLTGREINSFLAFRVGFAGGVYVA